MPRKQGGFGYHRESLRPLVANNGPFHCPVEVYPSLTSGAGR